MSADAIAVGFLLFILVLVLKLLGSVRRVAPVSLDSRVAGRFVPWRAADLVAASLVASDPDFDELTVGIQATARLARSAAQDARAPEHSNLGAFWTFLRRHGSKTPAGPGRAPQADRPRPGPGWHQRGKAGGSQCPCQARVA